ncbi:MAG: TetR/AcrR family transcriptional regulator [Pseudomonadota bacterium]
MSSGKIDTRSKILKTTCTLLETGGSSAVRMSDIAKASGVSRQAVYLHFPTRADLLVAAARYIDQEANIDLRLEASRSAESGIYRLEAFITAWANYIPVVYGVAKALLVMKDNGDTEAKAAWDDRMRALRHGCQAAINALAKDGDLNSELKEKEAVDLLMTLISLRNWEELTKDNGWSQKQYVITMQRIARQTLVSD